MPCRELCGVSQIGGQPDWRYCPRLCQDCCTWVAKGRLHVGCHTAADAFKPHPPCSFHGIQPSKNTRERRAKKAAEEVAKKRMASETGATAEKSSLQQMKEVGWHGRLGTLLMRLLCWWWCNCREELACCSR